MKTTRFFLACAFAVLVGHPVSGKAEDIDLYSAASVVTGTDLPNVMFVMDNAANFNASAPACTYDDTGGSPSLGDTSGGIEQCALVNAINSLPVNANGTAVVNIGIMAYNKNGMDQLYGCNASATGGCLVAPLRAMTAANKASIIARIKAWTSGGIQANNEATAQAMQETWAYYAGKTGMSGTSYSSPALSGCAKNYVIFIGNALNNSGSPGDASADPAGSLHTTITTRRDPATNLVALTAAQQTQLDTTVQIPSGAYGSSSFTCSPANYTMPNHTTISGLYADEWARYMHSTDLNSGVMPANRKITTYSIGVLSSACKADYPALLTSMAIKGGGKYFPTGNAAEIQQAILRVLNEVQAVNSVFSSASLPVSVNTQGTYLNQIYMGMFRPDALGNPRWYGNLKQYQFGYDSTTKQLFLADATGTAAISAAGTGFLSPDAASFWTCTNTPATTNNVYVQSGNAKYNSAFAALSTCLNNADPVNGFWANAPVGTYLSWDLADGEVVEKGGAAQMLRLANIHDTYTAAPSTASNPRNLYTYCPSGASCGGSGTLLSADHFDTSNTAITDTLLGTGPQGISSITSAATVQGAGTTPGASGAPATISITALSKSANTVTARASATDLAKLVAGATQLNIATGASKYDCNPCTVVTVNGTSFTYSNSGGSGTPTLPSTATIYSNFVTVSSNNHGLPIGQTLTFSNCTTHTVLNGTVGTITATTANNFTVATAATVATVGTDTGCRYTPNTATVTTVTNHAFATGGVVTVAGATPTGYNGSWPITVTAANRFTYQYTVPAPLATFSAAGATATSSSTTRDALTRWVRGEDNYGDEASLCPPGSTPGVGSCPASAVNVRPSIHGDVLHSRPVVINYGGAALTITGTTDSGTTRTATATDTTPIGAINATADVTFANGSTCKVTVTSLTSFTYPTTGCGLAGAQAAATASPNVMVFYGGNDGVFRAVNGNQVNPLGSSLPRPGGELWGFIPSEFFGDLKRLHNNSPALLMPSTLSGIIPTPQRKNYFVDGSTGVYQVIDGTGRTTRAYLYLAMRRGGRLIYALDVTNPATPKFLWKHKNTDSGFAELGQTWSQPKVAMIRGYSNPVLIFGAGYDAAAEDAEPPTADTMGRGIFILDALTGALVWHAGPTAGATLQVTGMTYSIPSDITLVDRNSDGKIDRLYVGDVGGNVWRVDLEPPAGNTSAFWQVNKLAALGCATGTCASGVTPRKIFYPPEVITTSAYDAVFTATGDREHPLYTSSTSTAADPSPFSVSPPYGVSACAVTNRAYLLKDTATGMDGSALTAITEQATSLSDRTTSTTAWNGLLNGYYVTFNACEKSVNAPLVTAGVIYFGTNQAKPRQSHVCEESLGEAVGYKLKPFAGTYVAGEFEGGGLPPSPVSGVVNVKDASGKTIQVPFCIGCGGEEEDGGNTGCGSESALAGCKPPINVSTTRSRTYWYIEGK